MGKGIIIYAMTSNMAARALKQELGSPSYGDLKLEK